MPTDRVRRFDLRTLPADDARARATVVLTELAAAFCSFHAVGHAIGGDTRCHELRLRGGPLAEFAGPRQVATPDVLRAAPPAARLGAGGGPDHDRDGDEIRAHRAGHATTLPRSPEARSFLRPRCAGADSPDFSRSSRTYRVVNATSMYDAARDSKKSPMVLAHDSGA